MTPTSTSLAKRNLCFSLYSSVRPEYSICNGIIAKQKEEVLKLQSSSNLQEKGAQVTGLRQRRIRRKKLNN